MQRIGPHSASGSVVAAGMVALKEVLAAAKAAEAAEVSAILLPTIVADPGALEAEEAPAGPEEGVAAAGKPWCTR